MKKVVVVALLLLWTGFASAQLTSGQRSTLVTDITNNTNVMPAGQPFAGTQVKDIPHTTDGAVAVAWWYSQATTYQVWRTDVPINDILDNVTWTNYTPNDAPDDTLTYNNRAIILQLKQTNLQLMLQGRTSFNAAKSTLRGGLNDATLNLPSGNGGANRSGGWANIVVVCRRNSLQIEKLFAVAATGVGNDGVPGNRGTATNPDLMIYEGQLSDMDVRLGWGI